MPRKLPIVTENYIRSIKLPNHGNTYTVIPNSFIIDTVYNTLNSLNLKVIKSKYITSDRDQMALGIYQIGASEDYELKIAFTWVNSYNKMHRFSCSVGTVNTSNEAYYIPGEIGSWIRTHKGTADIEAEQNIINQLNTAAVYYDKVINAKKQFSNIIIDSYTRGSILGNLFFEKEILSTYQASKLLKLLSENRISKSTNLWDLYNLVSIAIKDSHPRDWIDNHIILYNFIFDYYSSLFKDDAKEELPGQMSVFDIVENQEDLKLEKTNDKDFLYDL